MEYNPSPLVIVSRAAPVAVLVTVTVAPGSTAPSWSTTRPLMLAVAWANTEPLAAKHKKTASPTLFNITVSSCSRSNGRRPAGMRGDFRTRVSGGQAQNAQVPGEKRSAGARNSDFQLVITARTDHAERRWTCK